MDKRWYCSACHTEIAFHADGSAACSCENIDIDEAIPVSWQDGDETNAFEIQRTMRANREYDDVPEVEIP